MAQFILRRLAIGIVTLWVISVLVFIGTEILPGDVATAVLGQGATEETVEALRKELGLDRPAYQRYFSWLGGAIQGDLGKSLANGREVSELIAERFFNTLLLGCLAAIVAVPLSVLLGILAASFPDSSVDRSISYTTLILISFPEFFTAGVLVFILAVTWHIFPAVVSPMGIQDFSGMIRNMTLPVLTLTAAMMAHMTRMTRSAILDVLKSGYIEIAILKGVPKARIILRHAFPNSFGPVINVIAANLGYLVSGVVVVEAIFAFPGLGRMMVDSVANRDVPVVQAVALIFCTTYVGINLLADTVVILTNPRLRHKK